MLVCLVALASGGLFAHSNGAQASQDKKQPVSAETIRDLIKQLSDDSFDKREAADKALAAIGAPALELLSKAAAENPDAEVRQCAGDLIRTIGKTLFREVRRFEGHASEPRCKATRVAVSPDGKQAVSAGSGALRLWDIESGKQVMVFGQIKKPSYWSIAISADGQRALAGGEDHTARLFDLKTGQLIQEFTGHTDTVWGVAFLPGGNQVLTGSWDPSLRVWDARTGKQIRAFEGVRDIVRCLTLSPDGKVVAAGHLARKNGPGTIRLWNLEKGTEIRSWQAHTDEVTSLAYSPDGKTLLSASHDNSLCLWDPAKGKELKRLVGSPHRPEEAAFTPDGKRIVFVRQRCLHRAPVGCRFGQADC